MTSLPLSQQSLASRRSLRSLAPWLALVVGLAALLACPVALAFVWSIIEGPVPQYPSANALWPQFSILPNSVPICPSLHLGMLSNSVTNDPPEQVMAWYRAERVAYASQGGDPRRYRVQYALGLFRIEFQRTPSVYILRNQTQIAIATSLDLRWCQ